MKPRALVVDDKEENVYYLQTLLAGHGWEVQAARHGAEALVLARNQPPDLCISDLLMPVMDGYTLLRHWRTDPRLRDRPFLVYTATYTEEEDERLALALGADAFVLKPCDPEVFLSHLETVRDRGTGRIPETERDGTRATDEQDLLKLYSQTLIRKLEEKTLKLQEANESLHRDIAAREQMSRELKESEERFRQLAENIREVFWITDAAGSELLYVSPAYTEIWGRPLADLAADPSAWIEAVHPEDRERVNRARRARQTTAVYEETYRIVRPDGGVRWIHDRAFPVRDSRGEIYRLVGTAADITERRRLEEQVLRVQRLESIGNLAGGIAHDLNNVLAPILVGLDLLRQHVEEPELRQTIETMLGGARRGAGMIRQILSFARGMEGQRVDLDLSTVFTDLAQLVRETFPKNLDVSFRPAPGLPQICADPTQVHQVLLNLLVNARDAMPEGGSIQVTAEAVVLDEAYAARHIEARTGPHVCLTVADTGTGMTHEILQHIFDPFFTTKAVGQGTGLGLSTTLSIVKGHGGFLDVTSEPDRGTTVQVFLPVAGRPDPEAAVAESGADAAMPPGRGESILLVDDEESIVQITRLALETHGYRVEAAADGRQALDLFLAHPDRFAAVVTDMTMPVLNGAAAIRGILACRPQTVIIATSGFSSLNSEQEAVAAGAQHFLAKPYSTASLLQTLRQALGD